MYTSERELSISKLFSHPVQYKVPHYQRRYVWNKTNWRTLSEDILAELGLELEEGKDDEYAFKLLEQRENTSAERDKKHFTGIIVTRQISHEEPEIFEVIDGQQRLTTFQIILCVIRDIFESRGYSKQAQEPQKLIVNEDTVVERTGQETTYKFRPTNYDSSEFEAVANQDYGQFIFEIAFDEETNRLRDEDITAIRNDFTDCDNHNILDAYDYFYELTMAYINRNEDWKHELVELLITVKNHLKVVLTTLDESDHSEKIFESINATGRKLLEFDYLRNNLFLRAKQLDEPESEESHSDRFYRDYWHFENSHSYWSADKLESFLRSFLMAKLGPDCFQSDEENKKEEKKAFEVYQKSYYKKVKDKAIKDIQKAEKDKAIKETEYEFSELNRYSEAYREADISNSEFANQSDKIRSHMKFYDDLNMTSLLPFILYLQCEAKQTIAQLEIVFKILESYLVRRMVCFGNGLNDKDGDAYNNIHGYFSNLIKDDNNPKFDIKKFVQSLDEWPNDSELGTGLLKNAEQIDETKPNWTKVGFSFKFRYIFYRIEQYLNKESGLSFADFVYYNPARIASEQELSLVFFGRKHMSNNDWRELQSYYNNTGNLTFLRTSRSDSDEVITLPFAGTKEILSNSSDANLKLDQGISELSVWKRSSIINRRNEIYNHFRNIWPDQKSILEIIQEQTRKSQKQLKPAEKAILLPKTPVVTTPKTVKKQDSTLKTCKGKIKLWRGSYGYIESSDLETPIEVNRSDFQDRTAANPVEQGQKVEFKINQTQSGKNLKPINLVRIKQ